MAGGSSHTQAGLSPPYLTHWVAPEGPTALLGLWPILSPPWLLSGTFLLPGPGSPLLVCSCVVEEALKLGIWFLTAPFWILAPTHSPLVILSKWHNLCEARSPLIKSRCLPCGLVWKGKCWVPRACGGAQKCWLMQWLASNLSLIFKSHPLNTHLNSLMEQPLLDSLQGL